MKTATPLPRQANPGFDASSTAVFEKLYDFYGTLDLEGRVTSLSGSIFKITQTDPDLLVGQPFAQTVFWQSTANTARVFESAIEKAARGASSRLLLDFRVSADEKSVMEVDLQPVEIESGRAQIFVCGRIAESRLGGARIGSAGEQLLFAAENTDIGLWYWDFEEDKIYSTPRCNELFGLSAYDTLDYDTIRNTIHPDDRAEVEEFIERSRNEGVKYEEEFRILHRNGSVEWVCAEGKSLMDGNGRPQRMMGVVRDITQQKIASEELQRVHERERKAREEAVEANRAKDFFLAFVSHELRSPLNAILGWSKILLTKKVDEDTRRSALETIERSARFQTKLINDLVDSARVSSGKLKLEYLPANLYDIVRNSYQAQKPIAENRNIEFTFGSDNTRIPVYGDSNRLQQVFGNIISNALKFTPEGGKVQIEVRTGDEAVEVCVADTGMGIRPEALPSIFRQFSQGDSEDGKPNGGLGLGLSIVKILVTKHGGTVHAESAGPGKGSRFIVKLPLSGNHRTENENGSENDLPDRPSLKGTRILIVEDDQDSRDVLHLFFEQGGAVVASADSARSALAWLSANSNVLPDVIISDLAMPEEDGFSLITRIRRMPPEKGGRIPALALSAFTSVESRQRAIAAGFNRYRTKPFEPDLLVRDIVDLINARPAVADAEIN
jgi:PAS domain S-box-containing protein